MPKAKTKHGDSLTERQVLVLKNIDTYYRVNNYYPTMRELGTLLGITVHGAYCHVIAMKKKGVIDYETSKSRTFKITELGKAYL